MKPIKIVLSGCEVELPPLAYMINLDRHCIVGIERIPGNQNLFRFGTLFLQNFVTVLDYDKNEVHLGVNTDASSVAKIGEISRTPDKKNVIIDNHVAINLAIAAILIVIGTIGIFY